MEELNIVNYSTDNKENDIVENCNEFCSQKVFDKDIITSDNKSDAETDTDNESIADKLCIDEGNSEIIIPTIDEVPQLTPSSQRSIATGVLSFLHQSDVESDSDNDKERDIGAVVAARKESAPAAIVEETRDRKITKKMDKQRRDEKIALYSESQRLIRESRLEKISYTPPKFQTIKELKEALQAKRAKQKEDAAGTKEAPSHGGNQPGDVAPLSQRISASTQQLTAIRATPTPSVASTASGPSQSLTDYLRSKFSQAEPVILRAPGQFSQEKQNADKMMKRIEMNVTKHLSVHACHGQTLDISVKKTDSESYETKTIDVDESRRKTVMLAGEVDPLMSRQLDKDLLRMSKADKMRKHRELLRKEAAHKSQLQRQKRQEACGFKVNESGSIVPVGGPGGVGPDGLEEDDWEWEDNDDDRSSCSSESSCMERDKSEHDEAVVDLDDEAVVDLDDEAVVDLDDEAVVDLDDEAVVDLDDEAVVDLDDEAVVHLDDDDVEEEVLKVKKLHKRQHFTRRRVLSDDDDEEEEGHQPNNEAVHTTRQNNTANVGEQSLDLFFDSSKYLNLTDPVSISEEVCEAGRSGGVTRTRLARESTPDIRDDHSGDSRDWSVLHELVTELQQRLGFQRWMADSGATSSMLLLPGGRRTTSACVLQNARRRVALGEALDTVVLEWRQLMDQAPALGPRSTLTEAWGSCLDLLGCELVPGGLYSFLAQDDDTVVLDVGQDCDAVADPKGWKVDKTKNMDDTATKMDADDTHILDSDDTVCKSRPSKTFSIDTVILPPDHDDPACADSDADTIILDDDDNGNVEFDSVARKMRAKAEDTILLQDGEVNADKETRGDVPILNSDEDDGGADIRTGAKHLRRVISEESDSGGGAQFEFERPPSSVVREDDDDTEMEDDEDTVQAKRRAWQLLDEEAELSGSDAGADEEEEWGPDGGVLDEYEEDEDNGEVLPSQARLRAEVARIHARQEQHEDAVLLERLREDFLEDGDGEFGVEGRRQRRAGERMMQEWGFTGDGEPGQGQHQIADGDHDQEEHAMQLELGGTAPGNLNDETEQDRHQKMDAELDRKLGGVVTGHSSGLWSSSIPAVSLTPVSKTPKHGSLIGRNLSHLDDVKAGSRLGNEALKSKMSMHSFSVIKKKPSTKRSIVDSSASSGGSFSVPKKPKLN